MEPTKDTFDARAAALDPEEPAKVADAVEAFLGVPEGETTGDGLFSWEKVACLGCCSLSPVMMINGRAYGKLTGDGVAKVLTEIKRQETAGGVG